MTRWLLAALLLAPVKPAPLRVLRDGKPLVVGAAVLKLSGPFACSQGPSSLDCSCPALGIVAQGVASFVLSAQGQIDVDARWVTANTAIVCMARGSVPANVSLLALNPGVGFSALVSLPQPAMDAVRIDCIGAGSPQ